jgi:hypothetical protein
MSEFEQFVVGSATNPVMRKLLLIACLAACGDDGMTGVLVTPEEGGTITSEDGRFTLQVPPGAVAAPTRISITRAPADELPGAISGLVYDLQPDGLVFASPATATLSLTTLELREGPTIPSLMLATRRDDGTTELLAPVMEGDIPVTLRADPDGNWEAVGAVDHFTPAALVEGCYGTHHNVKPGTAVTGKKGDRWTETLTVVNAGASETLGLTIWSEAFPPLVRSPASNLSSQLSVGETSVETLTFGCDDITTG